MVFLWLSLTNVPLARNSEKVAKNTCFPSYLVTAEVGRVAAFLVVVRRDPNELVLKRRVWGIHLVKFSGDFSQNHASTYKTRLRRINSAQHLLTVSFSPLQGKTLSYHRQDEIVSFPFLPLQTLFFVRQWPLFPSFSSSSSSSPAGLLSALAL